MHQLETVGWGTEVFDKVSGGLPQGLLSVLETPDHHSGTIALGHFLWRGLHKGERCALISFDAAPAFLENFARWNMDFRHPLESGQMTYLNYQPNVSYEAGLSHDYRAVFEEIQVMCGGIMPKRLAIMQMDTLINLNNQFLTNTSAQKLAAAPIDLPEAPTILGQFVHFPDETHHQLAIAFQKTAQAYFSLSQPDLLSPSKFHFQAKKVPWFNHVRKPTSVTLIEGEGFFDEAAYRSQVA